jgi:hypothetical protein
VLIYPILDGHYAVPVLRTGNKTITPAAVNASWDAYHLEYHDGHKRHDLYAPILNRVTLWSELMHFLTIVPHVIASLSEALAILALRRTIVQCLEIYQSVALGPFDAPLSESWLWQNCLERLQMWDTAIIEEYSSLYSSK